MAKYAFNAKEKTCYSDKICHLKESMSFTIVPCDMCSKDSIFVLFFAYERILVPRTPKIYVSSYLKKHSGVGKILD